MPSPSSLVAAFYSAIEAGKHGDELRPYLADTARTIERPNLLAPTGRTSDRAAMLAASSAGASLLSHQRYEIRSLVEHGEQVVARIRWTGVPAHDADPFTAGQVLTAHIAQFIRIQDGLITEIETYDCYEPFT
jgi:ketosteroid isomerase-like protein